MGRAAVVALLVLLAPGGARAWTDAHVRGVHAGVEVREDGTARVSMELDVRIHAGWLEGLEVVGLDPGLALDEAKPPWAVSADDPSVKFEPSVRVEEGRLAFAFRGRGASPRAGTLRLGFVYTTSLAHRATSGQGDGTIRVRWTLPPWRSGLDAVTITVTTPAGAAPAPTSAENGRAAVGLERFDLADRTVLRWQRSHLPRTVPWTVEIDVPEEAMDEALRAPALPERPKLSSTAPEPPEPAPNGPIALAITLGILAFLGRLTFARACKQAGVTPRPLIPLPVWSFVPIVIAGCGWAAVSWIERPALAAASLLAVALTTLHRAPHDAMRAPKLGRWRLASRIDLRRAARAEWARRIGLVTPVDLTSVVGLSLLAAAGAGVVVAIGDGPPPPLLVESLALLAVPALTATRFHLPATPEIALARLARHARTLDFGGAERALALVVHAHGDGWQEARARIVHPALPAGLDHVDLALAHRRDLGGYRSEPVLIAVVRAGADAERALSTLSARRERAGDRVAFALPLASLAALDAAIAGAVDLSLPEVDSAAA